MDKFSAQELYDMALELGKALIHDRTMQGATVFGLAIFVATMAILWFLLGIRRLGLACLLAGVLAFVGFSLAKGDLPQKMDDIGHELANVAITQGVDQARKAQATELQYIHATVIKYDEKHLDCKETVDELDACDKETKSWYTSEEFNIHWVDVRTCDTNGKNCKTTSVRKSNWRYTPYFAYLTRYWIVADTKTEYLHPGKYSMDDMGGKPLVYLHDDWRAPQEPAKHTYNGRALDGRWSFNGHVPEFWTRVKNAGATGGPVVVATFVGQYFNWGTASESAQFKVYDGQYRQLKRLVSLPGPTGAVMNYIDAFHHPATMHTLLTSQDGDLPLDFNPVSTIGFDLSPENLKYLNARALEFQGSFGPVKQASARWFLVADSISNQLGGIINTTQALKAYMNDTQVWGNFSLPKNQVILVETVSDDGTRITGRNMETGMPEGNVLVEQRMRLSIEEPLFFTEENVFGNFIDQYVKTTGNELKYTYSDMSQAGGPIGLMYQSTPGWTPPDLNSKECTKAPAEHLGFIRHKMCTEKYRESTIQINKNGAELILKGAEDGANERTPLLLPWVLFLLSIVVAIGLGYAENQNS